MKKKKLFGSLFTRIAYAYTMRVINYNSRKSKRCEFVCYIRCEFFKAEIRKDCGEPMTDLRGFVSQQD